MTRVESPKDTIVYLMDSKPLKQVTTWLPAHGRYWQFVGLARHLNGDQAEVQVYGPQLEGFTKVVAVRRKARVSL